MVEPGTVEIVRLGAQGDGVAETPHGPVHVPLALPGERVRLADGGLDVIVGPPSPERRASPLCPHVPRCGGCSVQHMGDRLYAEWKHGLLAAALAQRGIAAEVAPMVSVPPRSRRRATLSARRKGSAVVLGYHGPRQHRIEDIVDCAVLAPVITGALPGLRSLLALLLAPKGEARLTLLATPAGLDVAVSGGLRTQTGPEVRRDALQAAQSLPIARLSMDGEPWLARTSPVVALGGVEVLPPPGSFLQAVAEAEAAIAHLVLGGIGTAKRIADLFCGLGTLTFPLARQASVLALDSDTASIEALAAAARRAQRLKPIEARVRNLATTPLAPRELAAFDAVVLDPPFAGAKAQVEALARSKVARVVAVSCNPATFARDVRILLDGGYRLGVVTPIDQFLWSAHVELVAVLRR
jgi:23S rRNA (uracil1939-C5)-methyltransferase